MYEDRSLRGLLQLIAAKRCLSAAGADLLLERAREITVSPVAGALAANVSLRTVLLMILEANEGDAQSACDRVAAALAAGRAYDCFRRARRQREVPTGRNEK